MVFSEQSSAIDGVALGEHPVFPGNGEMATRCRAVDWSATRLGPVSAWSASLRTASAMVLASRTPMFLWWGPDLVQIYNDAYRPSLGDSGRHPSALGALGRESWTDIWDAIGPQIEQVMTTGQATYHEDHFLPILRNGQLQDVWWTYGYSAIRDDDGSIGGTLVVCQETTQRILAEHAQARLLTSLENQRLHLAAIFDQAPASLVVLQGPDHVVMRVNPAYVRLVGNRSSVGKPLREALPEVQDQGFIKLLDAVRATGEPYVGRKVPVLLTRTPGAQPEMRYVDLVYQRLEGVYGDDTIVAQSVDVTDEVLSTASLRRTERQLRDQFAKLPVPTYLWEASGDDFVLIERNEAAVRAASTGGEKIGEKLSTIFPDFPNILGEFRRCLRDDTVVTHTLQRDVAVGRGRRFFDITLGAQPPTRVLMHAFDITERMELEEKLRQAVQMEAVGRLAGGVAHDFNNLLTIVNGHSALLLESLDQGNAARDDIVAIHDAGVRAAVLTRQLLAYSRQQILKPALIDLNEIVGRTKPAIARLLGEAIEVRTHFATDVGRIIADAGQLAQVLVNLTANAREAMPDGGIMTLATRNVLITEFSSETSTIPVGAYALLEISDTGVGMSADTCAHLFEPFFTTKTMGEAKGLGLATVYGIVTQSNGYIFVESAVGEGTLFRVFLPLAGAVDTSQPTVATTTSVRGPETVLVVDDEAPLRVLSKRVLERQGYNVLCASGGPEALGISAALPSTIHLVLSDSVMPGMRGAEVVRRLREQRPGLKALMMSGYADDEGLRAGVGASVIPFIGKPFLPEELAKAVRDAIDE